MNSARLGQTRSTVMRPWGKWHIMRRSRPVSRQPSVRSLIVSLTALAGVAILAAACRQTPRTPARTRRSQRPIEPLNRDLLSLLAHELRTPLNSIVGWINVLQSGKANATLTATALKSIASSAQAQRRLIEDIVDAMRAERKQMRLRMETLDLRIPIEAAIDVVKPSARSAGLALSVRLPTTCCLVCGDSDRLQQALVNVLANAVKFTRTGGIDVELVRCDAQFEVHIVDTGQGIDREFLPFVFERFEQAARSGRRHDGLGLGLAICRDVIEEHHGRISVDSDGPGQGTSVTVTMPALAG
jgi:signal transduction histidine kinase